MKDNLLFALAVAAILLLGYSVTYHGLLATWALLSVTSTLWFGWLAAFSRAPQEPLPFLTAYPGNIYWAGTVSLLSSAITLIGTGRGVFFLISAVASLTLIVQWWQPVLQQRMAKK